MSTIRKTRTMAKGRAHRERSSVKYGVQSKVVRVIPSSREYRKALDRSFAASAVKQGLIVRESMPVVAARVGLHVSRQWNKVHTYNPNSFIGSGTLSRSVAAICSIIRRQREPATGSIPIFFPRYCLTLPLAFV